MLVTPVREVSVQDPFIRVSRGKSKERRRTDREAGAGRAVGDGRHAGELRLVDVPRGRRALGALLVQEVECLPRVHRLGRDGPACDNSG
jgi:hypothetical protein